MKEVLFLFDEPCEYKGIKLYPILMKDYLKFAHSIKCLLIPKNRIPDPRIIGMPYLTYLLIRLRFEAINNDSNTQTRFNSILKLVLREQEVRFVLDEKDITSHFFVNGTKYNTKDFDKIIDIICEMNDVTKPDMTITQDAEKALLKAKEFKEKYDTDSPTIEEIVDFYHVWAGLAYSDIKEIPIRKFNNNIRKFLEMENYRIHKTAEMSGMVKFKQKIKHYFRHYEKGNVYDDVKISSEDFMAKYKDFIANK